MHPFISSHLLCGVAAAACATMIAVRGVREYREYHPKAARSTLEGSPLSLLRLTIWSVIQPQRFQTGREPSAR